MFGRIKYLARNVISLNGEKILKKVLSDAAVKEYIATLQQNQMYDFGVDAKGVTLGDYSDISVSKFNKPPGHIRMYDTGKFFNSIKIKADDKEVTIEANTIKQAWDGAVDLLDRWPDLLGLNEESLSKLRMYVRPLFIEEVRATILR